MSELPVFRRDECYVTGVLVDRAGDVSKRPPRWGSQAGNIVGDRITPQELLNAVTVTHAGTGISHTEGRFTPARNKELAFIEVERLVNEYLDKIRAAHIQAEANG